MPIYEYICKRCEKRFELFQKISEKPKKVCSECGGGLEKLVSSSAFHLKGTGWYATDYAKKSSSPESSPKKTQEGSQKPACKSTSDDKPKCAA